ncbi:MAG: 4Fe-4S binding protein [Candidatus Ranarchaeia archaeon]|jgi:ferredoxin
MEIRKAKLVYYSPTGTGKTTATAILNGTGLDHDIIDLTLPESKTKNYIVSSDELAIIEAPVYSGRLSTVAANRIKKLKGSNTPAVLVTMYGNRAFEDALLELKNITSELGFKAVAGAAFIGQHSFSSEKTPIAIGRPNAEDLKIAESFGEKIMEKLRGVGEIPELEVPGNYPYVVHPQRISQGGGISPETNSETCILCGICAGVCPTACIEVTESVITDITKCTACSACVHNCPTSSRHWTHERIRKGAKRLTTMHGNRKEPEVFL